MWEDQEKDQSLQSSKGLSSVFCGACNSLISNYTTATIIGHLNSSDNSVWLVSMLTFGWYKKIYNNNKKKTSTKQELEKDEEKKKDWMRVYECGYGVHWS